MIWIIIEMSFPALLIILPMSLYRSNRLFMAKFYLRMTGSESARKLYVQCMLIFLLLYHYVYAGGHFGEWGSSDIHHTLCRSVLVQTCRQVDAQTSRG